MAPRTPHIRLPAPEAVRRARTVGEVPLPDVWDAAAVGLIANPDSARQLATLHLGTSPDAPDREAATGATNYIGRAPSYVPYESPRVPRHQGGERTGLAVLATAFSPEIVTGTLGSPVVAALAAAQATARSFLSADRRGRVLARLAAIGPKKGGEIRRLLPEYLRRHAHDPSDAATMAVRDFWASWYVWIFPRTTDGRLSDMCGSIGCLTTAIDYVGAPDDGGGGDRSTHLAAAGEGIACLAGTGATRVLRDIALVGATMLVKEALVAAPGAANPDDLLEHVGGPVTPEEVLLARYWDGGLAFAIRFIMCTAPYTHLVDDFGAVRGAETCDRIKRALNTGIWHNEITDLVSDYDNADFLNGACLALALGGRRALFGYGDACARVTDDVLACQCGEQGHQEAAELAMGMYLWFTTASRYMVRRQLARFGSMDSPVQADYIWRTPGTRLRTVAGTTLRAGRTLHSPTWQPLWNTTTFEADESTVDVITRRVVARCLAKPTTGEAERRCADAARSVLTRCDHLGEPAELRDLADAWCALFDAAVDAAVDAAATDAPTRRHAGAELRPLVARFWRQTVVGQDDLPTEQANPADELLFMDIDHALRRTYPLGTDGVSLRRAFLGVASSAAELSGLNPLARLTDGAARQLDEPVAAPPERD